MKATVNGLAMIVLPPNISVEEAEVLFSEVLKKLRSESAKISVINANNEAFASIFNANDLFKPSEARVILADNLFMIQLTSANNLYLTCVTAAQKSHGVKSRCLS